jgi:hypothetical protein
MLAEELQQVGANGFDPVKPGECGIGLRRGQPLQCGARSADHG